MALNGIDISALILYKNNIQQVERINQNAEPLALILYKNNIQHKQPNKTAYIIDCVNPL